MHRDCLTFERDNAAQRSALLTWEVAPICGGAASIDEQRQCLARKTHELASQAAEKLVLRLLVETRSVQVNSAQFIRKMGICEGGGALARTRACATLQGAGTPRTSVKDSTAAKLGAGI
jgi:hypothetical protein